MYVYIYIYIYMYIFHFIYREMFGKICPNMKIISPCTPLPQ